MVDRVYGSIKDLAARYDISLSTAWKWVRSGAIPDTTYVKIGDTYRFDLDRVEQALLTGEVPPQDTTTPTTPRRVLDVSIYNAEEDDQNDD